jgi:hypothetical protein
VSLQQSRPVREQVLQRVPLPLEASRQRAPRLLVRLALVQPEPARLVQPEPVRQEPVRQEPVRQEREALAQLHSR